MKVKEKIFNRIADNYSTLSLESSSEESIEGFSLAELSLIQRFISVEDSLLLYGGGGVWDTLRWHQLGLHKLFLTDLSLAALKQTRQFLKQNSKEALLVLSNAVFPPFQRESVDHIYLCSSLYNHIPGKRQRQQTLIALKRGIKSGVLMVQCNSSVGQAGRLGQIPALQPLRVAKQWLQGNFSAREPGDACLEDGSFYHCFRSDAEIAAEFEEAGFQVKGVENGMWVL